MLCLKDTLNRNCVINLQYVMYVEEFSSFSDLEISDSDKKISEPFISIHFSDGQAKTFKNNMLDFLVKCIQSEEGSGNK